MSHRELSWLIWTMCVCVCETGGFWSAFREEDSLPSPQLRGFGLEGTLARVLLPLKADEQLQPKRGSCPGLRRESCWLAWR